MENACFPVLKSVYMFTCRSLRTCLSNILKRSMDDKSYIRI